MEQIDEELAEELEGSPALPPVISQIECSVKDGKGIYEVCWGSEHLEEEYEVTLYRYEEVVAGPQAVQGTSYTLEHEVERDAQYYIGVAPSRNRAAEVRTAVFSDTVINLAGAALTGEYVLCLDYFFPMSAADEVDVRIENEDERVRRDVTLAPYNNLVDLQRAGLSGLKEFKLYVGAACYDHGVPVYQSVYDLPGISVNTSRPVIGSVCLTAEEAGKNSPAGEDMFSLVLTQTGEGVWAEAEAGISLYGMGDLLWTSDIVEKAGGVYKFEIKRGEIGFGKEISLRIFLQAGLLRSDVSLPQNILAEVPECSRIEYTADDKVLLRVKKRLGGFYGYRVLTGENEARVPFEDSGDMDLLTVPYAPEVRLAYDMGKLRGFYSVPVVLQQAAYYLFGDKFPCICMSDSPKLDTEKDIEVLLSEKVAFTEDVTSGVFHLARQSVDEKTVSVLRLDKAVWDFSAGAVRETIKTDYETFLSEMEKNGVSAVGQREVQELIGDYLPQSVEEFAYYNYYLHDNRIDVFPGMVLRAEYSMYQYVGDDVVSVYENGYTGTFSQESQVVCRDGKICLDVFSGKLSGGKYIPFMEQPRGGSELSAFGAAGFLDTQFEDMKREYLRLCYPDEFPELDGRGHTEVSYNVCMMAAGTRSDMEFAWKLFQDTGVSASNVPVACFRGRAHVTPCVPVHIFGREKNIPFFSTARDFMAGYGGRLVIRRKGKRVYCFKDQAGEWLADLPLYPGDLVELY